MGWAALPLQPPSSPSSTLTCRRRRRRRRRCGEGRWRTSRSPIVVDVDVAAEEPADQEPRGRPAEDKEAELDARKRALDERERTVGRREKMVNNMKAMMGARFKELEAQHADFAQTQHPVRRPAHTPPPPLSTLHLHLRNRHQRRSITRPTVSYVL